MSESKTLNFGLTKKQFQLIEKVIISFDDIERVFIFGSRATNYFSAASDIDLVVSGMNLSGSIINRFSSALDDLPLPFKFDVLNYDQITNVQLKNKILSQGKLFFERQLNTTH
jgi:proline iminopeptidase